MIFVFRGIVDSYTNDQFAAQAPQIIFRSQLPLAMIYLSYIKCGNAMVILCAHFLLAIGLNIIYSLQSTEGSRDGVGFIDFVLAAVSINIFMEKSKNIFRK